MTESEFVTLARIAATDAEQKGFHNTAQALRQIVRDMSNTCLDNQIYAGADQALVSIGTRQN